MVMDAWLKLFDNTVGNYITMNKKGIIVRLVMFLLLYVTVLVANADVYKWTDADGRVHYSDKPINKSNAKKLNTRQTVNKADSDAAKTRLKAMQLKQKRNEQQRKADQRAAAAQSARQSHRSKGLITNCNASSKKLKKLKDKSSRKYTIDKKTGERHWMTSDEIDSMTNKHQNYVNSNC